MILLVWRQCYVLENVKLKKFCPYWSPEHFCYGEETMLAWQEGRLASDIVEEHKKLKEADIVIFQVRLLFIRNWILYILFVAFGYFMFFVCLLQFPMYWFSVPAIMKGWMDRVLTLGFAYTLEKRYSAGIFRVRPKSWKSAIVQASSG